MILDDIFQNDTSSLAEKTDLGPRLGTKRDQGRVLRKWRKSRLGEQDSQDMAEAMKPSDIPTSMRSNRLTMRDIEKERPQGAYRFTVGDKEFMDLDAAREFARGTGEIVKPIRETVKKKLGESSRSILAESCQGLTRPQRLIVEGIYNDFKPLLMLEAELTANQIQQLFVTTQKNAGRTLIGKGVDAASTVNQAIDKAGKWLQDTTPVKMADEKFAQLKTKISAKFPELDKTLTGWGTWMKANPGKSAAIIGILTTIAALGGGPAGGAIAGQILRGTAELLKGEKISTAVGKGVKTAALGALAGYTIDQIGDLISGGARMVADNIFPGATRLRMNFDVSGTGASTFQNVTAVGRPDDIQAVRDMFNGAAKAWNGENYQQALSMFDKARDMAQQLADPKYVAALTSDREMAQTIMAQAKNLVAATDAVAAGAQGAIAGTVGNKSNAQPTNEYIDLDLTHRAWTLNESLGRHRGGVHLNQHGIDTLFALVINEGPLDLLKRGAAAVGGAIQKGAQAVGAKASQIGQSITNKTTADALNKAWTKAGKPTDHNKVAAVLRSAGVKDDVIKNSFGELKLPAPQMSVAPSAAAGDVADQAAGSASVGQDQTATTKKQTGGGAAGAAPAASTPATDPIATPSMNPAATDTAEPSVLASKPVFSGGNPFQQPAPIRSKDPITGKQIEPEYTPSEVPPQYADYQSNLARYMAKYGQPAAAPAAAQNQPSPKSQPGSAVPVGTQAVASDGNTYQWLGAQWGKVNPATGKAGAMATKSIADELNKASSGGVAAAAPAADTAPAAPTTITPAATTAKVGAPAGKAALDTAVKTIDTVRSDRRQAVIDYGQDLLTAAEKKLASSRRKASAATTIPAASTISAADTTPAAATAPAAPAAEPTQTFQPKTPTPPWVKGDPIRIGKQVIKPTDPNYNKVADALSKQGITEKKRPVPTNKPLWGRAKAAARSKFDVYPSAYANAWAAKWYKSHGGGWRMGKGAKK